jgi:hypothetical protein
MEDISEIFCTLKINGVILVFQLRTLFQPHGEYVSLKDRVVVG